MPNMPAQPAVRAALLLALAAFLAAPVQAEEGCLEPCESTPPPEDNPCADDTSGSCGNATTTQPEPIVAAGPTCRPVEFTGGAPRLQLYPVLNMVAINPCIVGSVGVTIHPPL